MSKSSSFIRTDRAIMFAFIELLKEKSFEKITVQDILDKTPVTRATFYAHYKDKYEIAEIMLQQFLHAREDVRSEISGTSANNLTRIVRKSYEHNQDLVKALLKIHTDTVDLRRTIVEDFAKEYLEESTNTFASIESRIYAQSRAELELSHVSGNIGFLSFDQSNEIFLNAALKLLRLSDDPEVVEFMNKKLSQKFHTKK